MRNLKKASLATACILLLLPAAAQAEEMRADEAPSFKARIIARLKTMPESMYWEDDGQTSEQGQLNSEKKSQPSLRLKEVLAGEQLNEENGFFTAAESMGTNTQPFINSEDAAASFEQSAEDREVVYEYRRGVSYDVTAAPGFITDVQLQPGEMLTGITAGDSISWAVETRLGADKVWHVFVKPLAPGAATNMIINTDRHYYSLRLLADKNYVPVISWTYPGEAEEEYTPQGIAMEVESVEQLNFNYRISGAGRHAWAPVTVFDDGFKTYLVCKEGAAAKYLPAVFRKRSGLLFNMDYKIANNMIILDRVCREIYLAVNNHEQVLIKNEQGCSPWDY